MDVLIDLLLSTDWKGNSYDSILVIINHLTKIVYDKLVKVAINSPRLPKVIIDVMLQHHGLLNFIISECRTIFMSKFLSWLCYFFGIKKQLSTTFHFQTNRQTT